MSKQLKEKIIDIFRWGALGNYTKDEDGNFVSLEWGKSPDSVFDAEVADVLALITSEKKQLLERLLEKRDNPAEFVGVESVVGRSVIELELQKLKEENNANNKTPNN